MNIKALADIMILPSKREVLRVHLYSKLVQHDIKPFENDIDILLDFYIFGGYNNSDDQATFIQLCIDRKYRKTEQSMRNFFSKYTTLGVLIKPRNKVLIMNDLYIPQVDCDKLVLTHKITHAE